MVMVSFLDETEIDLDEEDLCVSCRDYPDIEDQCQCGAVMCIDCLSDGCFNCGASSCGSWADIAVVYLIKSRASGLLKIGFTKNAKQRFSRIVSSTGGEIDVIVTIPGDVTMERSFHDRHAAHRQKGEWFVDCKEIRDDFGRMAIRRDGGITEAEPLPARRLALGFAVSM